MMAPVFVACMEGARLERKRWRAEGEEAEDNCIRYLDHTPLKGAGPLFANQYSRADVRRSKLIFSAISFWFAIAVSTTKLRTAPLKSHLSKAERPHSVPGREAIHSIGVGRVVEKN